MPNNEEMTRKDKITFFGIGINAILTITLAFITITARRSEVSAQKIDSKVDKSEYEQNKIIVNTRIEGKADKSTVESMQSDIKEIRQWTFEMYKDMKK